MIIGAYCVGKVQVVFDNGSILCMLGTKYATLVVLFYWKLIV